MHDSNQIPPPLPPPSSSLQLEIAVRVYESESMENEPPPSSLRNKHSIADSLPVRARRGNPITQDGEVVRE